MTAQNAEAPTGANGEGFKKNPDKDNVTYLGRCVNAISDTAAEILTSRYRRVIPENVPLCLVKLDRWVVWRGIQKGGRWTKPPVDPRTGRAAQVDKPATWGDFETAMKAYRTGDYDGIGIVLTEDMGLVGFDFDHCVNAGGIAPEVQGFLEELGTYAEFSPTDGIRALDF